MHGQTHAVVHGPETLSFDELITLATVDPPPQQVAQKLDQLLSTPFISNEAAANGARAKSPAMPGIGRALRIAEWNINRGENEPEVQMALSDAAGFVNAARDKSTADPKTLVRLSGELEELQTADVLVLDEVDDGVKRTKYRNVARDLATALNMNYAYAVEFVELQRIYMGEEKLDTADKTANSEGQEFGVDPKRYLGLEGSAVLSRYPIRGARIVRLPLIYDWYHQEIKAIADIERVRRWSAQKLFNEEIKRQVRRGGRMAMIVDLEVPESPTGIVTVICPHLEDYSGSRGRRREMEYLLNEIRGISNPVILTGDLNTTGKNGRPLTIHGVVRRYVLNYRFWARQVVFNIVPVPGLSYAFHFANYLKNLHDPTAFNVPIFLPNPARHLFDDVKAFRFADGIGFDFGGNRKWSFGGQGSTLADSNERAEKGFTTTFSFARTYGGLVGKYKLDWFFVKPAGTTGNALFQPRFGRTLPVLNQILGSRISDHCPITVTLPIGAPFPEKQTADR